MSALNRPDSYLAKFPADHRATAERAYQDGFSDGANETTAPGSWRAVEIALAAALDNHPRNQYAEPLARLALAGEAFAVGWSNWGGQDRLLWLAPNLEELQGQMMRTIWANTEIERGKTFAEACEAHGFKVEEVPGRDLVANVKELIAQGLDFGATVSAFAAHQEEHEPALIAYRDAARTTGNRAGETEVDSNAMVSKGDDSGAYVMAWVWVEDRVAGVYDPEQRRLAEAEGYTVTQAPDAPPWAPSFQVKDASGCVVDQAHSEGSAWAGFLEDWGPFEAEGDGEQ